jgi:hypothetical protein
MTCRPGERFTSKHNAGSRLDVLKPEPTTSVNYCSLPAAEGAANGEAILDGRMMQSTVESGNQAGYNGDKRKCGSQGTYCGGHFGPSADNIGGHTGLVVTLANDQERGHVRQLAIKVQKETGEHV